MACGAGSDVPGLGRAATCVLFWRGAKEIFGAGGVADRRGTQRRVPDQLFGINRKFVSPGSNGERPGNKGDCDRGVHGREDGRGKGLPTSNRRPCGAITRFCKILSRLSSAYRERRASC